MHVVCSLDARSLPFSFASPWLSFCLSYPCNATLLDFSHPFPRCLSRVSADLALDDFVLLMPLDVGGRILNQDCLQLVVVPANCRLQTAGRRLQTQPHLAAGTDASFSFSVLLFLPSPSCRQAASIVLLSVYLKLCSPRAALSSFLLVFLSSLASTGLSQEVGKLVRRKKQTGKINRGQATSNKQRAYKASAKAQRKCTASVILLQDRRLFL